MYVCVCLRVYVEQGCEVGVGRGVPAFEMVNSRVYKKKL